jgi:hypothetical protein
MKPLDLRFPKRMTIGLPEPLREGLETIADREPHENDEQLVQVVLSRGIVATLTNEINDEPPIAVQIEENLKRLKERIRSLQPIEDSPGSKFTARAARPFPAPSVLYKRRKKQVEGVGEDIAYSETPESKPERATPAPHRQVERYVAAPISEELRDQLQAYLDAHPELDEETALTTLLQLGLEQSKPARSGSPTEEAEKRLRLAERLYLRAKATCGL